MIRIATIAAALALTLGAAPVFAISDDINKPLASPDGISDCTDDPALINDVKVYDPNCKEGGRSLPNMPERDKADVPPRKDSIESPPPPDTGEALPPDPPTPDPM
ncbi:MAG: hypothetical protein AB7O49_03110 [Sphingomonadales bacterium]